MPDTLITTGRALQSFRWGCDASPGGTACTYLAGVRSCWLQCAVASLARNYPVISPIGGLVTRQPVWHQCLRRNFNAHTAMPPSFSPFPWMKYAFLQPGTMRKSTRPTLPLLLVLWACSSVPGRHPEAESPEKPDVQAVHAPAEDTQSSEATEIQGTAPPQVTTGVEFDKDAVLAILMHTALTVVNADSSCQETFAHDPQASIARLVREQRQRATRWDAVCKTAKSGRACVVTLQNNEDEAREFFARYSFDLDDRGALVESSLRCVLAG